MLEGERQLDLVVIPTPLAEHHAMCIEAFAHGCHVLLEKPPAVTIQDMRAMIAAQRQAGVLCQVNFQHTSSQAFHLAMKLLGEGRIGRLQRVVGRGIWKRTWAYYQRTSWSGRLIQDGRFVLDGTLHNTMSHLLNQCMLAAGGGRIAWPTRVEAECYTGYPIEAENTVSARIQTREAVDIYFYTTLCHPVTEVSTVTMEGERGKIVWYYDNRLSCWSEAGERHESFMPNDQEGMIMSMYDNWLKAWRGEASLYSPLSAGEALIRASNAAFLSSGGVHALPEKDVRHYHDGTSEAIMIPGIQEWIDRAIAEGKLFSELGIHWAVPGRVIIPDEWEEFRLFN